MQGELSSQVLEVERSKADMEELLQHNARLQQDSEEHQALKGAYNSLLNRSEAGYRYKKHTTDSYTSCVSAGLEKQTKPRNSAPSKKGLRKY